jgi:hypothetical protein
VAITNLLKEATRVSGNVIPSYMNGPQGDISSIVKLTSEIALQFGIQEDQLIVFAPKHGKSVVVGEKYHHCQDGGESKGRSLVVDIVTLPSFSKVRDTAARSELVYVPCEIYPKD